MTDEEFEICEQAEREKRIREQNENTSELHS